MLPEQQNIADNTFNDIIEFVEVKEQKPTFELFTLLDYTTMNIDFKLVFGNIKCIDLLNAKQVITMACTICLQEHHVGALGQHWANQATGKAYTTADISLLYTQATIHEDDPDLDRFTNASHKKDVERRISLEFDLKLYLHNLLDDNRRLALLNVLDTEFAMPSALMLEQILDYI